MERDQPDDVESLMNESEPEEPDGDEWRSVQMYGTHLYAIADHVELDELDSFPPDSDVCTSLDRIGSKVPDEEQAKREEIERAADVFEKRRALREWDLSSSFLVIAIGHGEHFSLTKWTPDPPVVEGYEIGDRVRWEHDELATRFGGGTATATGEVVGFRETADGWALVVDCPTDPNPETLVDPDSVIGHEARKEGSA